MQRDTIAARMGITALLERLAAHFGRTPATVGRWVTSDGAFHRRLASGAGIRPKRAQRVLQWCSDRWPEDLPWPSDLERPTPNPAALWEEPSPAPICIAAASRARERALAAPPGSEAEQRALAEALRIGSRLDPAIGQVAYPNALCAALGVQRGVYDNVVAQHGYHRGRPRRTRVRRYSDSADMFAALRRAGDVRFQPPPLPLELAGDVAALRG